MHAIAVAGGSVAVVAADVVRGHFESAEHTVLEGALNHIATSCFNGGLFRGATFEGGRLESP